MLIFGPVEIEDVVLDITKPKSVYFYLSSANKN